VTQTSSLLAKLPKEVNKARSRPFELSEEESFGLYKVFVSNTVVLIDQILEKYSSVVEYYEAQM